jgi:hypothetical protein
MHCWQNWPLALTCAQLAKVIVFWLEVEEVPEFVVAIVEVIVFEELELKVVNVFGIQSAPATILPS